MDPVIREELVRPPACMFDAMVVSTEWREIAVAGLASIGDG